MPSLRGSRHLGKEGRSTRATESMFEVPQARSSQRIKTVSILLEEKTRLEAQSGEGGWEGGGKAGGAGRAIFRALHLSARIYRLSRVAFT